MQDELAAWKDIDEARKRDVGAAASAHDAMGTEHRQAPPAEEMQNAVAAAEEGGASVAPADVAHQSARSILFVALLNGIKFAPIGLWVIAHHVEEQLNFRLTSTTMV